MFTEEKKNWDGKCQFFGWGVNVEEDHQRLQRSVYDVREMEYKAEDAQWTSQIFRRRIWEPEREERKWGELTISETEFETIFDFLYTSLHKDRLLGILMQHLRFSKTDFYLTFKIKKKL